MWATSSDRAFFSAGRSPLSAAYGNDGDEGIDQLSAGAVTGGWSATVAGRHG